MSKEVADRFAEALRKLEEDQDLTSRWWGVSILEIENGKVSRFRAYFDPRRLTELIVD